MNPNEKSDFDLEEVKADKLSLFSSDSGFEILEKDSNEEKICQTEFVSNFKLDENKIEIINEISKKSQNLIIEKKLKGLPILQKKQETLKQQRKLSEDDIIAIISGIFLGLLTFGLLSCIIYEIFFGLGLDLSRTNSIISKKICVNKTFTDKHFNNDNDCCKLIYSCACNLDYDSEKLKKCKNIFEFNKFFRACLFNVDQSDFLDFIYNLRFR